MTLKETIGAVEEFHNAFGIQNNYSPTSDLGEADFFQWLTTEIGVAAIPLSAFYGNAFDQRVVRFCFAKKDDTLKAALARLANL